MKIRILTTAIFLVIVKCVVAQDSYMDSLKNELNRSNNDTTSLLLLAKITDAYSEINFDSVYVYAGQMRELAKKLNLRLEEATALNNIGYALLNKGNIVRSLQILLSVIAMEEDPASEKNILPSRYPDTDEFSDRSLSPKIQRLMKLSRTMQYAGILYFNAGNYEKALEYYRSSLPVPEQTGNYPLLSITYSTIGRTYLAMKKNDSALFYLQKAYEDAHRVNYNRYIGSILLNIGRVHRESKNYDSALYYYRLAVKESKENNYFRGVSASNLLIAEIYKIKGVLDSNYFYISNALAAAHDLSAPDLYARSYKALADYFKTANKSDSAVKYQSLYIAINDSIFNSHQSQQFQNIDFDEQQRQQEIQAAKKEYQNQMQKYLLLGGLAVFLLAAIFLWRSNRHRQKSNAILQRQNREIEIALANLKTTQTQLIQSEKMASLGELTAGIAHEIQNPLNFVNNFSELNKELLGEMNEEILKGNFEEAKTIAKVVTDNEEKINHHGKRADAIVKGMLQHSRSSSGIKGPTDINALADEYLRLAYHGLKAKDKTFNAKFETDFDKQIEKINLVPQDIGRVLLNLYNNAFYAVNEKAKLSAASYEPQVVVKTKKIYDKIEIRVQDNGNGIPGSIKEKIFQPFFTTKPTGQGTGLGLSLSYDIVKAHGGEIKMETVPAGQAGTIFIIQLPVV